MDYPFIFSIEPDGTVYCESRQHCSGMFFPSELQQMLNAIQATVNLYNANGITDEYVDACDENARQSLLNRYCEGGIVAKKERADDDLYLIHDKTNNFVKIGHSKNVQQRLKQLQTASGNNLSILFVLKGGGRREGALHEKFDAYRVNGEWFSNEQIIIDEFYALGAERMEDGQPKKGALDLSIVSEEMRDAVETWLAYKREKGQTYKPMGFKTFYKRLCELSGGNPHIAMQIVENSMQNNYAGIFPISNNHQAQTNGREERAKDAADLVSRLLAENNA